MDGKMFDGAHTAVNKWADEGGTLAPHLAQPLIGSNKGDPRFNGTTPTTHNWSSDVVVSTPLTRGGGTMAK